MKKIIFEVVSSLVPVGFITAVVTLAVPASGATVISDWVGVALTAVENAPTTGDSVTAPTSASRAYGILGTAMYDAWSAYESTPISTVLGDSLPSTAIHLTAKRSTVMAVR